MSRIARLVAAAALAAAVLPAAGGGTAPATAADPLYRPLSNFKPSGDQVRIAPEHYSAVRVDLGQARDELSEAPRADARAGMVFSVPTPTGGTERFTVHRTRTMEAKLAAAHPELATYAGRSLEHPDTTIALDITQMGLHAAVRGPQGQRAWYVDPAYDRPGTSAHLSYYGGAIPRAEEAFVEREAPEIRNVMGDRAQRALGGWVSQKVYRLAFATDPTYAEYFGAANVLAEKLTLINRVNQIYNDDLAIRMVLIDETDDLNFDTVAEATGANGPCGSHPCYDPPASQTPGHLTECDLGTLGRNRIVLGQLVGAANYDIGHIGLGVNGGGIAYLGVAGWDYKGGGCTGLPEPEGDFFALDYVAHELGHQFDGHHTFFACGGIGNGRTGIEPGSGSTVMAYAGICGADDLQPHTDPYFSAATVDEVNAYTNNPTLPVVEVQTVSLTGFGPTDTLTLEYGDESESIDYEDYDAATVKEAVEDLIDDEVEVTIAEWGYDPSFDPPESDPVEPDATGFQVIFAPQPYPDDPGIEETEDFDSLTVSGVGVTGFVGETAKGGTAANGGNEQVATGNRAPTAHAPANKTLPIRTPFTLRGSGKDPDGQPLTYLWEQTDWANSAIALTSNNKTRGPLFRMFGVAAHVTDGGTLQSPSPGLNRANGKASRTFPDMVQILSGNTNAKNGRCPRFYGGANDSVPQKLVNCYSEYLPTRSYLGTPGKPRAMHFRVSIRDRFEDGGGLGYDEMTLRISPNAGPFLVTSFAKGGNVKRQTSKVIEWKVNGTKRLAKSVRILLSTNGGKTWTRTLTRSTPNDGKAKVRIPKVKTKQARIMIAANSNYFFDVNDKSFKIR